ncbi:Fur family transcriptional regulator [Arthrobacter pigmenti]
MRVTRPRTAVLTMVSDNPHSDADTIVSTVRRDLGSVSIQGVYDVLHALTDAGLLRRIEPAGSPARFETRVGDNHHHLVCRKCGVITDVNCVVGEAPCLDAATPSGFAVEQAEVTFWGTCPGCLAKDN